MSDTLLQLLPMILGSALVPIWVIMLLLILRSPNGLIKGFAFVAGATLVRLVQGMLFGYVFGASDAVSEDSAGLSSVVAVLLMVIGILLLIAAIKTYRNEPDPDDPSPKWMKRPPHYHCRLAHFWRALSLEGRCRVIALKCLKLQRSPVHPPTPPYADPNPLHPVPRSSPSQRHGMDSRRHLYDGL